MLKFRFFSFWYFRDWWAGSYWHYCETKQCPESRNQKKIQNNVWQGKHYVCIIFSVGSLMFGCLGLFFVTFSWNDGHYIFPIYILSDQLAFLTFFWRYKVLYHIFVSPLMVGILCFICGWFLLTIYQRTITHEAFFFVFFFQCGIQFKVILIRIEE